MTGTEMQDRTVVGLLAYCDWLRKGGYQTANTVEAWKVAIKKLFGTVEPDKYESISLEGVDLDDWVERFRVLAQKDYKAETITVYGKRVRNAIDAHEYYLQNRMPPTFRKAASRNRKGPEDSPKSTYKANGGSGSEEKPKVVPITPLPEDSFEFDYPLAVNRTAHLRLPKQMTRREIDRLCAVIQTLEEVPQIPEQTGQAA